MVLTQITSPAFAVNDAEVDVLLLYKLTSLIIVLPFVTLVTLNLKSPCVQVAKILYVPDV